MNTGVCRQDLVSDAATTRECTALWVLRELNVRGENCLAHPLAQGMLTAAVKALRGRKLEVTMGANCTGFERVERLAAVPAFPVCAGRW